jgi:3-phosphoshikimate 1-carboxyvinyltransferase
VSLRIQPGRVDGRLRAPSSKSHTHRAFLLGALNGNALVRHPLRSDDTEATLRGLEGLGLLVTEEADGVRVGGHLRSAPRPIDARESGTTLRLLTPMAALLATPVSFTGRPRLAERPMDPLLAALRALGARVERPSAGFPLTLRGPLKGGHCRLPGDQSSQFLSGLLFASPLVAADTDIELTSPVASRPYVDLTLRLLRDHGLRIEEEGLRFHVPGGQRARQKPIDVPGDYSSAAFLLAAAAVTGGRVTVDGLDPDDAQGDRAILDHLRAFGADVSRSADAVAVEGGSLRAADLNLGPTPDLFPVLAAVAACAPGTSRLHGAPHLRAKESDRIRAMHENLRRFGVASEERPDGLVVHGGHPRGAQIAAYNDHRVAMAGAVLALAASGPSELPEPDVVQKSYPGFTRDLASLAPGVLA